MHTITQFGKRESGEEAGLALAALFRELGTDIETLARPSEKELDRVFEFIWSQNATNRPYPSVIGFLSTILRRETYCAEIMHVFGTSELIQAQSEYAPVCNLPTNSGIIAFGYWTGDLGDGDEWCLDIRRGSICCIPIGLSTLDEAKRNAYAVFHDFSYLEAFLRRSAELKGWLQRSRPKSP